MGDSFTDLLKRDIGQRFEYVLTSVENRIGDAAVRSVRNRLRVRDWNATFDSLLAACEKASILLHGEPMRMFVSIATSLGRPTEMLSTLSHDFKPLERRLRAAFLSFPKGGSERDRALVCEFIDATEYGLALDLMIAMARNHDLALAPETHRLLTESAKMMHASDDVLESIAAIRALGADGPPADDSARRSR